MNLTDKNIFPKLWDFLSNYITEQRKFKLEQVASMRTRFITVVIEDVFQPHNASAVLRSCECHGIQDVHIIENKNEYRINPDIVLGSANWLDINRWNEKTNNTTDCIKHLKSNGYKIAATSLHDKSISLNDYKINDKTALIFGSEVDGISDEVKEQADVFLKIPMCGFTESFNISVSAAICLNHLCSVVRNSNMKWQLEEQEKNELLLKWISKQLKSYDKMVDKFMEGEIGNR